jgi:hypothetical protein
VEIKGAVRNAIAFAIDSLGQERTIDIRLEEIESSTVGDRPVWLITLSSALIAGGPASAMRALAASMGAGTEREYKVFTVTKDTGEILSMKIRMLAAPA